MTYTVLNLSTIRLILKIKFTKYLSKGPYMNIQTVIYNIESSFQKGDLGKARKLIESNKDRLGSPSIRSGLSSDVRSLLDIVLKEEEKQSQTTGEREHKGTFKITKNLENQLNEFKKKEQIVFKVNEFCKDLNWGRAKELISNNPNVFSKAEYQSKLNAEAKVLVDSVAGQDRKRREPTYRLGDIKK